MKTRIGGHVSRIQLFSCILIAALLPIVPIRYINILVGILLAATLVNSFLKQQPTGKKANLRVFVWFCLPFFLLALMYLIDALETYETATTAFKELEKRSAFVILPLVLALDPCFTQGSIKKILKAFTVGVLFVLVTCYAHAFYQFLFNPVSIEQSLNWNNITRGSAKGALVKIDPFFYREFLRPYSITPVYLSMYVCFSIASTFYLYFYSRAKRSGKIQVAALIVLAILSMALIQLSVRGIIIPFFLLSIIFLLWYLSKTVNFKIAFVFAVSLVLVTSILIDRIPILKERFVTQIKNTLIDDNDMAPNSLDIRMIQFNCAYDVFKRSPVFGWGEKKSEELLWSCSLSELPKPYRQRFNVHNQFLEFLIQVGLAGLLLFVVPIVAPLFKFKKVTYLPFLLIIFIAFLTESILSRYYGFMFILFLYIVIVSHLICNQVTSAGPIDSNQRSN